jgi:hypothetical protein
MPTLAEYEKADIDPLLVGVYDNIITHSEIANWLEFEEHSGVSSNWLRESSLGAASTHQVGDTWVDTEPSKSTKTAKLTTVGIQHPLDRMASQTLGSTQSQQALLMGDMTKSLTRKLEDLWVTGDPGTLSTDPEGLTSLLIADSRLLMMDDGSTPSTITGDETELDQDRLDAMIDMIEGGPPDILLMNKTMRRKITSLARQAGSGILLDKTEAFGRQWTTYANIPIVIDEWITNSEQYENSSGWASSTATTIYALKLGREKQGFTVLHNGPVLTPDIQNLGTKFNKNEDVFRMAVYVQNVLYSAKACAGLAGIDSAA